MKSEVDVEGVTRKQKSEGAQEKGLNGAVSHEGSLARAIVKTGVRALNYSKAHAPRGRKDNTKHNATTHAI